MALSWNTLCRLLLGRPASFWLRLAGLLPVAAYLNSNVSLQYEHSLRPESIFPFFAMLSLFGNLELIRRRWFDPAPQRVDYSYVAVFLVPLMIYRLKPSFGFGVVFAMLPGMITLLSPGIKWGEKAAIAFLAVVGIASLLISETALKQGDPFTKTFLPDTVFNLHADMVLDQLNRDLAEHAHTPYPEEFMRAVRDRLAHLLEVSRRPKNNPYPSLGFSPDYLMFIDNVFTPLYPPKQHGGEQRAEFEMYYFQRTVLHQPGRMLAKVWRQMRLFYRFGVITKPSTLGLTEQAKDFYQRNVDFLNTPIRSAVSGKLESCAPGRALKSESVRLAGVDQPIGGRPLSGAIQAVLGFLYLPGLLASLGLGTYSIWKRQFVMPTMLVALVYSYNFGNNLTIAIVHSLDADRYVANELALTLFASAAGWLYVASAAKRLLNGRAVPAVVAGSGSTDASGVAPALQ